MQLNEWQDECLKRVERAYSREDNVVFLVECPRRYGKTTFATKLATATEAKGGNCRVLTTSARNAIHGALPFEQHDCASQWDFLVLDNWDHMNVNTAQLQEIRHNVRCVVLLGGHDESHPLSHYVDTVATHVFNVVNFIQ